MAGGVKLVANSNTFNFIENGEHISSSFLVVFINICLLGFLGCEINCRQKSAFSKKKMNLHNFVGFLGQAVLPIKKVITFEDFIQNHGYNMVD